jgi:hypothetical protein
MGEANLAAGGHRHMGPGARLSGSPSDLAALVEAAWPAAGAASARWAES